LTVERLREELSVVENLDIVTLKVIADAQTLWNDLVVAGDQKVEYPPSPTPSEHGDDIANPFVAPVGPLQILALPNSEKDVFPPRSEYKDDDAKPHIPVRLLPSVFESKLMAEKTIDL
jgi:hypothetical protein